MELWAEIAGMTPAELRNLYDSAQFERRYGYRGWLGARRTPQETEWRLWTPAASEVSLRLYSVGSPAEAPTDGGFLGAYPMTPGEQGVWSVRVPGDCKGVYYTYRDNPDSATHALDLRRYFDSTTRRVRLSLEVFFKAGRIPAVIEREWLSELSKDAYRMCIRKNLKKNRDAVLRRELFVAAGEFLKGLESDCGFRPVGLNLIQRLIWRACRTGGYVQARALAAIT